MFQYKDSLCLSSPEGSFITNAIGIGYERPSWRNYITDLYISDSVKQALTANNVHDAGDHTGRHLFGDYAKGAGNGRRQQTHQGHDHTGGCRVLHPCKVKRYL